MAHEATRTAGGSLSLRSVTKYYRDARVVDQVDLEIESGEFVTFLGPSGSGKTTTLNMIAGFAPPSEGEIRLDGVDISTTPAHRRGIGMVFQHYALFPHMTVEQNVAYPFKQRKVPKAQRAVQVADALRMVELEGFGRRMPAELSGGQQQRVALARALALRPPVLLMDEPLGALDKRLREVLQISIKELHKELGITFVYVTHDQDEALLLSDRIAVFNDGRVEQIGTAVELYERPVTRFVAEFMGDSNIFTGVLDDVGAVQLDNHGLSVRVADRRGVGASQRVATLVRPEHMQLVAPGTARPSLPNRLRGVVRVVRYHGTSLKVEVETPSGGRVHVRTPSRTEYQAVPGELVEVAWAPDDCVIIADDRTLVESRSEESTPQMLQRG